MSTPFVAMRAAVVAFAGLIAAADPAFSGQRPGNAPPSPSTPSRVGVQGFAIAGVNWPLPSDSFEAVGLDPKPLETGGAARVSGIWRDLFAQLSVTRWRADGERVFVSSDGTRFQLGIPLEVQSTYVDASIGWESIVGSPSWKGGVLSYMGGGMGTVLYSETSPFAQTDDDLETQKLSYHLLAGVDVPLAQWFGITGDVRFRWVPGLLGEGGASQAVGTEGFNSLQTSFGVRIGLRARRPAAIAAPTPATPPVRPEPTVTPSELDRRGPDDATVLRATQVFLLPDATRTALKTLDAGATVEVLEVTGDWVRIAFNDPALGRRIGYVLRKDIQIPK